MRVFRLVFLREFRLLWRCPALWLMPLSFFLLVAVIFAIAIGAHPDLLRSSASGVLWASAFLSALLSVEAVFRTDYESGFMEQILLSPHSLPLMVLAKICAYWLFLALPLLLVVPLAATMLYFPLSGLWVLLMTIPLGTAILCLIAAFGVALTLTQKNSLLLVLIVLPLAIPALIFCTLIVTQALNNEPFSASLSLLLALLIFMLTILPFATSGVLRILGGQR